MKKDIVIFFDLSAASHRRRLNGIFRIWGDATDLCPRIVTAERDIQSLLTSDRPPDGFIIGRVLSRTLTLTLCDSGIPTVFFVEPDLPRGQIMKSRYSVIHCDNVSIGELAANHFRCIGRFATYAYLPSRIRSPWSTERGNAFASSLKSAGIDSVRLKPLPPEASDFSALSEQIARLPKPIALFAAWDKPATEGLIAAREAGLRVPDDLAVIGVDNDNLLCEYASPPLTSIETASESAGMEAARELDRLFKLRQLVRPRSVTCPPIALVERASTRIPAPNQALVRRAREFITRSESLDITPNDVARHLNVSRRRLDSALHEQGKQSLARQISDIRLKRARQLLAETKLPIKDIFARVGFKNVCHASRLFHANFDQTPRDFRLSFGNADYTRGQEAKSTPFSVLRRCRG